MPRVAKRSASQAVKSGPSRRSAALPQFVTPQLSQPVKKPPSGPQWLHEIKLAVEPQEVVLRLTESADGCVGLQATMWSMPVIAMEPVVQLGGSLI
jgi:hypothetical protein